MLPVQIAAATSTYAWSASAGACADLRTLCEGTDEGASPFDVFLKARNLFREEKVDVAFLPSYSPARFFALFAAAKSLGIRTVMMNESHAGTEQATGSAYALRVYGVTRRWVKRQIVKQFDAALVGGEPHKRHFASLGIPADKIFTGYDAVDGDFFASRADEIRAAAKKSDVWRVTSDESGEKPGAEHLSTLNSQPSTEQSLHSAYGLPDRYFLSLGRMVEKKNLATLVSAYARYVEGVAVAGERLKVKGDDGEKQGDRPGGLAAPQQAKDSEVVTSHQSLATRYSLPALVFVGSGELEGVLREQARGLGLMVIDRSDWKAGQSSHSRVFETAEGKLIRINTDGSERLAADRTGQEASCRVTPAVGKGPQSETDDCKLTPDDSAVQRGAVYFYGFRQIEENPVFYALAEAFVLPSLKEEWGLVVNEAMACSLPVIVSRTAGCAEDLLPGSESWQCSVGSIQSGENADADDCKMKTENSLERRSNGFVFDPSSVEALSEALGRIADPLNPKRSTLNAAAMGRRSREIVAKFSCENFARQALRAADAAGS